MKKEKVIAFLLAGVMALSLAACGGFTDDSEPPYSQSFWHYSSHPQT